MANPLRSNNTRVLDAIRKDATTEYRRRIPSATQGSIEDTMKALFQYKHFRNEFVQDLVNKVGLSIFNTTQWENPLAMFKRGQLEYGSTIEEITTDLIKATPYDHDRDSLEGELFGRETPTASVQYHTVNRESKYKITVDFNTLRRAFVSEQGLSQFISQLMEAPQTSDNWDEFLLMSSLFSQVETSNGLHKIQVPNVSGSGSTEADAKYMLRRVREMAGLMKFPSRRYNSLGYPVAVNPEELVLFITPSANAAMDVEALAGAFNIERADVPTRTVMVPEENFNIPGAQAILSTEKFFVVADQLTETTSQPNAAGLYENFWLHHHQVMSASLAAPTILFTTGEGTVINLYDTDVTAIEVARVENREGTTVTAVQRGELYQIFSTVSTTPEDDAYNPIYYALSGVESGYTYVTKTGVLHIGPDETSTSITVTAKSSDSEGIVEDVATLSVYGDLLIFSPLSVRADADDDGLYEVTPDELTMDAESNVTIPTVTGVQYLKDGVNVTNGSIHNITVSTTFTAVPRANFEFTAGSTTSWTFAP